MGREGVRVGARGSGGGWGLKGMRLGVGALFCFVLFVLFCCSLFFRILCGVAGSQAMLGPAQLCCGPEDGEAL